jgi:hypothetical protein
MIKVVSALLVSLTLGEVSAGHVQLPRIMGSWKSLSGNLEVVAHSRGVNEPRYVTVQEAGKPASATKLCEFLRNVEILISSNDDWICHRTLKCGHRGTVEKRPRGRRLQYRLTTPARASAPVSVSFSIHS